MPSTVVPGKSLPNRRNEVHSRSTTATSCPIRTSDSASDDPTRPHPITTMYTGDLVSDPARRTARRGYHFAARRGDHFAARRVSLRTVPPPTLSSGVGLIGLVHGLRFAGVQAHDRHQAAAARSTLPQRHTGPHAAAEADRAAGVRVRCDVVGGLRARGDLPGAVGRGAVGLRATRPGSGLRSRSSWRSWSRATGRTCTPTRPAAATTRWRRRTSDRTPG